MNTPLVTCLQLSYGRPQLSVEAVECFLRQTYSNKKLIIINTHPSPVYFNKPYDNIEVHNIKPLKYLSDIYNFGLDLIDSDYLCVWDDDDLFMPWHIEDRVNFILEHPKYNAIGHKYCVYSEHNQLKSLAQNMFSSQYLYKNNEIRPDGGILPWDVSWDHKWNKFLFEFPLKPSYIYRWATGETHISGQGGSEGQHQLYLNNIETKQKIKLDFPWEPKWNRNYVEDLDILLKNDKNSPYRIVP